jgi:hypothetical protein
MPELTDEPTKTQEPRLWRGDGWTAQVIKNEDDDGWAVAMTRDGESEPALVGPWTMGRDKKNPKPLDTNAFNTLVKTASEFVRRSEQQLHAALHQSITVTARAARVTVSLHIVPDDNAARLWASAPNKPTGPRTTSLWRNRLVCSVARSSRRGVPSSSSRTRVSAVQPSLRASW